MGRGGCAAVRPADIHPEKINRSAGFFGSLQDIAGWGSGESQEALAERERAKNARQTNALRAINGDETEFTWEEVEEHTHTYDCWIVIKGNVYDVTEFAPTHPGGRAIYSLAGRDASDVFTAFHEPTTWGRLKEFKIGTVKDPEAKSNAVIKDFRQLRHKMVADGMFHTSIAYYMWKVVSTFGLSVAAAVVLTTFGGSAVGFLAASLLLGLFWQQSGWLCHDFCHNQVFKNRSINKAFGFLTGPVFQGFSVTWWNDKHNTHHAVPNEIEGDSPVDPDIDTLPFIAWDTNMLNQSGPTVRKIVSMQHYLIGPILMFARISWSTQSFLMAIGPKQPLKWVEESGGLLIHYSWMMAIPLYAGFGFLESVGFLFVSQLFGGLLLGYVFLQSHNAMEVYSDRKDFASAQVVSTRNIHFGLFNNWFTGAEHADRAPPVPHHAAPQPAQGGRTGGGLLPAEQPRL